MLQLRLLWSSSSTNTHTNAHAQSKWARSFWAFQNHSTTSAVWSTNSAMPEFTVTESLIQSKLTKESLNEEHKDTEQADKVRGVQQKSMTGGYWTGSGTVRRKKRVVLPLTNLHHQRLEQHTHLSSSQTPDFKLFYIIQQLPIKSSWKCSKASWCFSQRFALQLRSIPTQVKSWVSAVANSFT